MEGERVGFILIGLKTEQFAIFEDNYSSKDDVELKTELEFKINEKTKTIGVFTTFIFEQKKQAFLKLQISCQFKINEDSFDSFCKESEITVPKELLIHITMITVSSARGVLHAKTEGTEFNKFLLPTMDVTKMVKEDVSFSLNK